MDLERIKQNLRLRSGRTKKVPKKSKAQAQTQIQPKTDQDQAVETVPEATAKKPDVNVETPTEVNHDTSETRSPPPSAPESKDDAKPTLQKVDSGLGSSQSGSEQKVASSAAAAAFNDAEPINQEPEEELEQQPSAEAEIAETDALEATSDMPQKEMADPYSLDASGGSEVDDFDLKPPAPRPKPPSIESISELLFSKGHLNTIIYNPVLVARFTAFLQKYRPQDYPLLMRYLETSKAITAIEYANAVAVSAPALPQEVDGNEKETSNVAAVLDESFQQACSAAFDTLIDTSLPLYITYSLIRVLSECLIDEITGRTTPLMHDMVGGLSEVFCLTDPTQEDNPIIYASEEFYRLTGYGQEDVIGFNCRFLQGAKTKKESTRRLRACLDAGDEVYETLLNYRRDGKPFINVLLIAPLHDSKGKVKYHLGAQVDVSKLIEGGGAMPSFQKYMAKRASDQQRVARDSARTGDTEKSKKKQALDKLRELSELFDLQESAVVQSHSRNSSVERDEDARSIGSGTARRRLVVSDASDEDNRIENEQTKDQDGWSLGNAGPLGLSGKLPGVYESYMLIRPMPSLRIVFTSPKLRKFGDVSQSPFLSHVAAPASTLSGLAESFKNGIPVSAKINFMSQRTEKRLGTKISPNQRHEDGKYGRACWMSATPLLGSDDRIGVWMIVFVEKAQAKARRGQTKASQNANIQQQRADKSEQINSSKMTPRQRTPGPPGTNQAKEDSEQFSDLPIKPKRLEDDDQGTSQQYDNQSSASVYQHRAATPVEEYHSIDEDTKEETSQSDGAPNGNTSSPLPKDDVAAAEEYVRPRSRHSSTSSTHRLRISSDSDQELEHRSQDQDATVRHTSSSRRRALSEDVVEDEPIDPNEISPSTPSDTEGLPDEEEETAGARTPSRPVTSETERGFGLDSEETLRHRTPPAKSSFGGSSASDEAHESQSTPVNDRNSKMQSTRNTSGLGYMDYLSIPESRRKAPRDEERGRTRSRNGSETNQSTDLDCMSPYSVD